MLDPYKRHPIPWLTTVTLAQASAENVVAIREHRPRIGQFSLSIILRLLKKLSSATNVNWLVFIDIMRQRLWVF